MRKLSRNEKIGVAGIGIAAGIYLLSSGVREVIGGGGKGAPADIGSLFFPGDSGVGGIYPYAQYPGGFFPQFPQWDLSQFFTTTKKGGNGGGVYEPLTGGELLGAAINAFQQVGVPVGGFQLADGGGIVGATGAAKKKLEQTPGVNKIIDIGLGTAGGTRQPRPGATRGAGSFTYIADVISTPITDVVTRMIDAVVNPSTGGGATVASSAPEMKKTGYVWGEY